MRILGNDEIRGSDIRRAHFSPTVPSASEEVALSDGKRNPCRYLPLVLNQQPLPVSLDLDDLVRLKGSNVP